MKIQTAAALTTLLACGSGRQIPLGVYAADSLFAEPQAIADWCRRPPEAWDRYPPPLGFSIDSTTALRLEGTYSLYIAAKIPQGFHSRGSLSMRVILGAPPSQSRSQDLLAGDIAIQLPDGPSGWVYSMPIRLHDSPKGPVLSWGMGVDFDGGWLFAIQTSDSMGLRGSWVHGGHGAHKDAPEGWFCAFRLYPAV